MQKVSYKLSIGGWSIDSSSDPRTELLAVETFAAIHSPAASCRVVVFAPPKPKAGLLEEAVGAAAGALGFGAATAGASAFSIDIRGQKVTCGDPVSLTLAAGDLSATVMTAELRSIESTLGAAIMTGRSGGHRLATTRVNQVYQNQTVKQICSDLASQSGVDAGDMDDGSTYPYFVVHESRSLWAHVRDLARRDGLDLYFDVENHLTVKKFQKTTADHTLHYGIDVLDLEMLNVEPSSEHVIVYGESPSSSTGADTWYWTAKDLQPFRGETGQGARMLAVSEASVRAKDAAAAAAASTLGAIRDGATIGRLKVLGDPTMQLGDAVEIQDVPTPELNGTFKVTSVRHVYSKGRGFVTTIGFSGKGGASQAAGGLLGQAAALAGAIGL